MKKGDFIQTNAINHPSGYEGEIYNIYEGVGISLKTSHKVNGNFYNELIIPFSQIKHICVSNRIKSPVSEFVENYLLANDYINILDKDDNGILYSGTTYNFILMLNKIKEIFIANIHHVEKEKLGWMIFVEIVNSNSIEK